MLAADIAKRIPEVREVRPGKYEGPCPLHGGKSGRSFAFENSDDGKVLTVCRAGCPIEEVLAVVGLKFSDLYSDVSRRPDPVAERKNRAGRGLEEWRNKKLTKDCGLLRKLDRHAAVASELLAHYEETGTGNEEERGKAWESFAFAYKAIPALEHDFHRLNSKNRDDHLAVYREHKEAANAAA